MKITDLINKLQETLKEHGDIPIVAPGEHYGEFIYAGMFIGFKEVKEMYGFEIYDEDDADECLDNPQKVLVIA